VGALTDNNDGDIVDLSHIAKNVIDFINGGQKMIDRAKEWV